MKARAKIAVIGGSGLYEMKAIVKARKLLVKTPFGSPSGPILLGEVRGVPCAFLPRHGKGHVLLPSEINQRANIYALKSLGVERVVAVAAVGSLKEELAPRHFVFPDQLIDETKGRVSTFFGSGVAAHVAFDAPFCEAQSAVLYNHAKRMGLAAHRGGAYVCMEGPAYSTKAESDCHRRMGCSVIGMTACPEAKLAREAELCYSTVALVTDYDCWKEGEEVSTRMVLSTLLANVADAQRLLEGAIAELAALPRSCRCPQALDGSIITACEAMDRRAAKRLGLLLGKYLKKNK